MASLKDAKKTIGELAELLGENDLTEIEVEQDGLRIRVARAAHHTVSVPAAKPAAAPAPTAGEEVQAEAPAPAYDPSQDPGCVKSPMVGTVYVAPEPGADPFVKVGDAVKQGQTLLIVEAMKVMNQIAAHRDGVIKEIFVADKQPVEYDEPLMLIG